MRPDHATGIPPASVQPLLVHESPAPVLRQSSELIAPRPTAAQLRLGAATTSLYDSRRGVHYAKPLMRGWLHLIWLEASLIAGTLLIVAAHGVRQMVGVATYVGCLSGLFGVSALYHRGTWGPVASRNLQRADHVMIFLVIAGTATPVFLIAVPGAYGLVCLVVLWTLTAVGIGMHLARMNAPEWLVGGAFIGLGAVNTLALPSLWINFGIVPAILAIIGGLLYITGAVAYHRRWPDPFPTVFGYHEVFHAFVCAAATCHFVAIMLLIA